MDCLFCKIIDGEIPGDIIHQDEHVIAFNDINRQAPQHVLIVPRKHIATINDVENEDKELIGHCVYTAQKIAAKLGLSEDGYRLVYNVNSGGGQAVYHIHLHLLGGRQMNWPPG
jgi:histidine triad (HIT) family protein